MSDLIRVMIVKINNKLMAKDHENNLHEIKALMIIKDIKPNAIYAPSSEFFKIAIQPNTKHKAELVKDNSVILY